MLSARGQCLAQNEAYISNSYYQFKGESKAQMSSVTSQAIHTAIKSAQVSH